MNRTSWLFLLMVLFAAWSFAIAGCGEAPIDYSSLDLVPVTGKITLDGKPLANARVRFVAADGAGSEGMTDAEGMYFLRYDSNQLGATAGHKKVIITTSSPSSIDDPDTTLADEKLPAKYNSASILSADVSSNRSQHDFSLVSE